MGRGKLSGLGEEGTQNSQCISSFRILTSKCFTHSAQVQQTDFVLARGTVAPQIIHMARVSSTYFNPPGSCTIGCENESLDLKRIYLPRYQDLAILSPSTQYVKHGKFQSRYQVTVCRNVKYTLYIYFMFYYTQNDYLVDLTSA